MSIEQNIPTHSSPETTYKLRIKHECSNLDDTDIQFPNNPNVLRCGTILTSRPRGLCREISHGGFDWEVTP